MEVKKQSEIKDCGIYVTQALHKHFHGEWINETIIKNKATYGSDGINMFNLINLLNQFGIKAEGFDASVEDIIKSGTRYYIALMSSNNMGHYVIIKYNGKFCIYDSIKGEYKLTKEEFEKQYLGSIIFVDVQEYKMEPISLDNPFKYLIKNWNVLVWIAFTLLLSICFTFSSSLFMKIIIDKVIPAKAEKTLIIVCISFAFLAILRAFNKFLKSFIVKKLIIRMQRDITYNFIEKINKSSFIDLSKVTNNDLLRRFSLIGHISSFVSNSIFVLCNELVMFAIATAILIWISTMLFAIAFASAIVILIITMIFRVFIKTKYDELVPLELKSFNSYIDIISLVSVNKDTTKLKKTKDYFDEIYEKQQSKDMEIFNINNIQSFVEELIMLVMPIVVVYFGVRENFSENISVGSLLMFVTVFHHFINPLKDLATLIVHLPEQKKHMKLVSFVMNLEDEKLNEKGHCIEKIKQISFEKSSIGYDRELFSIDRLAIDKSFQLIAKNGFGKSAFLNTISTLIKQDGLLKFNNINVEHLNIKHLRQKMIYINPQSYLPSKTILEFITKADVNKAKVFAKCVERYNLTKILDEMNLSLEAQIENDGKNISSGQRQITFLLQLFTNKYDVILLDEALENIDPKITEQLRKNIIDFQNSIFIEVSHSKKYICERNEVNIEKFN